MSNSWTNVTLIFHYLSENQNVQLLKAFFAKPHSICEIYPFNLISKCNNKNIYKRIVD